MHVGVRYSIIRGWLRNFAAWSGGFRVAARIVSITPLRLPRTTTRERRGRSAAVGEYQKADEDQRGRAAAVGD
jgi:hypothetical protein